MVHDFFKLKGGEVKIFDDRLRLFRLVIDNESITEAQIKQQLQDITTPLPQLQEELCQDIMDVLLLFQPNIKQTHELEMQCRKHLMQGKLMINRGLVNEGITTLKSTLVKSEQLELHDVCLSIYSILSVYEQHAFYDDHPDSFNGLAKDYAYSVLHTIRQQPNNYSNEEVAGLHLEIARLFLKQQNFGEALNYSLAASKKVESRLNIQMNALRIAFLCYYHGGDLNKAEQIMEEVSSSPQMYSSSKLIAIWSLNKAALQYAKRDLWGAMETLKSNYPIIRNNPFWVVGYRFMEILTVLEMRDYEWVDYKLGVVSKFMRKRPKAVTERLKHGYQLLRKYLDYKKCPELFALDTSHKESRAKWDPMSSEIINIESWYALKMLQLELGR